MGRFIIIWQERATFFTTQCIFDNKITGKAHQPTLAVGTGAEVFRDVRDCLLIVLPIGSEELIEPIAFHNRLFTLAVTAVYE